MSEALIVIDAQKHYLNDKTQGTVREIQSFLQKQVFDKVLFTRFVNFPDSNWVRLLQWEQMMPEDADIQIVDPLQPFVNESLLFDKTAFSIFRSAELRDYLDKNNIDKLYLCGMDTDACVYASALEAYERNYDIRVVADLCAASHGKECQDMAIDFMRKNLGKSVVVTSNELI